VVDVSMSDDDCCHFELVLIKYVRDPFDLISRVNDNRFACSFLPEDGAVALQ
jgi:hypothetical protein